ncbi:lysophospholipid acyltransferase family protein [Gemmata sp. G18]|uniref:Lysophospholipid acyltransferase family protein n=1 Tax=Gemmata palustris TaxID=2822762 RepID=A0ABS5BRQ4_9BACT|nr:lysophospholipid acyltransferase family protein [Gemmata palustris]MBP3956422.1 lysophospholipid acyltransferase family protein [Gemmata palustris]
MRRGIAERGADLPHRWPWLIRGFRRYACRYVRKNFHAVRLSKSGHSLEAGDAPLLVVLNHPSWWDPLIGIVLSRAFIDRDQFAAIDAVAVQQYRFFQRLGFVGVDTKSLRGAVEFLRAGAAILSQPRRVFWVTAQGRFTDARERPLGLQSGVGHLAARLNAATVLPIAIEYAFWTERTPEALVRVGEPLKVAEHPGLSGKEWTALIETALTHNLDALNAETMRRDPAAFTELLTGETGVGGVYDSWRRLKSWARGRKFDPAHDQSAREAQPGAKS